jgi:hypothetical protein
VKRNRNIYTKNNTFPKPRKTPKSSPFTHGFVRGITRKKPRKVHAYIPHQIPTRKVSKRLQENRQQKAPKITKKGKWERHNQALRNHAESSIHTMKVHKRSSLPPDHSSLSKDLNMKLSS